MTQEEIPEIVVNRLPRYLIMLNQMAREGFGIASSTMIAQRLRIKPSQLRKDLSYFEGYGRQGAGYQIFQLIDVLQKTLHLNRIWQVALVGLSDLSLAIVNHEGIARRGFEITLALTANPERDKQKLNPIEIADIKDMEKKLPDAGIKIVILDVPAADSQEVAERLVSCGVKGILCCTSVVLNLPNNVRVEYFNPLESIQRLTYYVDD